MPATTSSTLTTLTVPDATTAAATRRAEYRLIASYRDASRASVDDFHRFLVALGVGDEPAVGAPRHGRFWALVACLLSVQCRDHVALAATRALMAKVAGEGAAGVAALSDEALEALVKSCNFCKTKAKNVRAAAEHAAARDGRVPSSYDALLALPGVGPKIAHLMRSVAYGEADAGIVVDTHVFRVATRLGWVDAACALAGAERVRIALETWVPLSARVAFSLNVVGFGQLARTGKEWGHDFVQHVRARPAGAEDDDDAAAGLEETTVEERVRLAESMVRRMDRGERGGRSGDDE